ncbi:MAG: hypothetical protein A2Y33_02745 [Spirochaetes bacterium GWF1_51_8]|nr:MAG: hypothetical protein A2Y33_02745 [Spirochaetes bacterium GWF1_51_8]
MDSQIKGNVILGSYQHVEKLSGIKTRIDIDIMPGNMGGFWPRCGITADYCAQYLSLSRPDLKKGKNTLSFVLNELLENAVKYTVNQGFNLAVMLVEYEDQILFEVSNFINEELYGAFKEYIEKFIMTNNTNEKYLDLLKTEEIDSKTSMIGLLTLIDCFNPKIGFEFERTQESGIFRVRVQVILKSTEI